jgi:hypothetical protein
MAAGRHGEEDQAVDPRFTRTHDVLALCTLLAVASAAPARVAAPVRAAPSMAGAAEHLDEGNARFIIQGFCVCA